MMKKESADRGFGACQLRSSPSSSGSTARPTSWSIGRNSDWSGSFAAPWPSDADGNTNGVGISLQRLVAMDYGNDPVNWIAGVPTPGGETGPAANQPPTINFGPTNRVVSANTTVIYSVSAGGAVEDPAGGVGQQLAVRTAVVGGGGHRAEVRPPLGRVDRRTGQLPVGHRDAVPVHGPVHRAYVIGAALVPEPS